MYFERLVKASNHLGLFSEMVDPRSGELLGNVPQLFTHIGLIDTALHLAYAEGGEAPILDPMGSAKHRAEAGRS